MLMLVKLLLVHAVNSHTRSDEQTWYVEGWAVKKLYVYIRL